MTESNLALQAQEMAGFLQSWMKELPKVTIQEICTPPEKTMILSVDLVKGFCDQGPLSGPRAAGIVPNVKELFAGAYDTGVRSFVLIQDTHSANAVEFNTWPVHCVKGTEESETVDGLKELPFFDRVSIIHKNSIDSFEYTSLDLWVAQNPQAVNFIVTGDCTDLCVYQLAMRLRTKADARNLIRRVIVPADQVQTYDLSVTAAQEAGILPHPGDLLHAFFLYHMALNGVEIVRVK